MHREDHLRQGLVTTDGQLLPMGFAVKLQLSPGGSLQPGPTGLPESIPDLDFQPGHSGRSTPHPMSTPPAPPRHPPCVMDLISMVLGMRSSEVGCTDFRLILDLKRVLIKVDFPKPLCPGERMEAGQWARWVGSTWALSLSPPQ